MRTAVLVSALTFAAAAFGQTPPPDPATPPRHQKTKKPAKGTVADVGSGAASVAGGAAKGAADLVTLHPLDAGAAVGTGAVKGAGKVGKGIGHALKKIF